MAPSRAHGAAKVVVVTPWLDHLELASDYWQAMEQGRPDGVLVIDNGSRAPLGESTGWPRDGEWVRTERLPRNAGFARGCNRGLELAGRLWRDADAVLFVNNDIAADEAEWLEPLRDALRPGVLVGAELREEEYATVDGQAVPYLDGWCLGGLRADLLGLNGFDEGLAEPAYYSDVDLCFRAVAAGMQLRAVPVALRHKGNVTAGSGLAPDVIRVDRQNYARFAARVRAERRSRTRASVTVVVPFLDGENEAMLAEALASVPDGVPTIVARNHGDYAAALNAALREAETEFVQFLGHDDRLGAGALELLLSAGADVAYPTLRRSDEAGSPLRDHPALPFDGERLLRSNFVPGVSLVRRTAALAVGGFRDLGFGTHEDWDLWVRMHRAGHRLQAVPAAMVHVRERPRSRSKARRQAAPGLLTRLRTAIVGEGPLTIVQLAPEDPAGSAWRLHRAVAETTAHRSLLFRRDDNWLRYPTQHTFADGRALADALAEADVVHVHLDSTWLEQLSWRPVVIHHHGTQYRAHRELYDDLDGAAGAVRLVSNLELTLRAPDLKYLPHAVPYDEWNALARGRQRSTVLRLAHSPTKRELKGTEELVRIVAELRAERVPIELVLIEGQPWTESLRIRASCDATFDSFWLGLQCSGCEAACMDQPVVAGDADVAREWERRYGYVPYTFAGPATLKEVLRALATDEEYYERERDRIRAHMRTHHDLAAVASTYLALLAEAGVPANGAVMAY